MKAITVAIIVLLLCAQPSTAQYTCYAYRKTDGLILGHAPARTTSYNPTGITTDAARAVAWLLVEPPRDITNDSGKYQYRLAAGSVVKLSNAHLDTIRRDKLIDEYEEIIDRLVSAERALELHPGNAQLIARRDALLAKESEKWADIVAP